MLAMDPKNPNILLAGTRHSNLFRSGNGGQDWTLLTLHLQAFGSVQAILIDPSDTNRYLVGLQSVGMAGGGLYESKDAGKTWKLHPQFGNVSVQALTLWPGDQTTVVAGTRQGVWRSSDLGATWARISPVDNVELHAVTAVAFDPRNVDHIYAGTTHLPWKTTDGGKTWNSIHPGMVDDSDVFSIYVNPREPDQVFASACSGIYTSPAAGSGWRKFQGIPFSQRRTHIIRQDPENPMVLYAGTTTGLLKSTDGGATWRMTNQIQINWLLIHPQDPKVIYFAAEHSGIWKSTDKGETITPLNNGFVNQQVNRLAATRERIFLDANQDGISGGVFSSNDGGNSWNAVASRPRSTTPLNGLSSSPQAAGPLFATTETQLLRSADGGKTWFPVPIRARASAKSKALLNVRGKVNSVQVLHVGGKTVLALAHSSGFLRSDNLGATWTRISPAGGVNPSVLAVYASAEHNGNLVIRTADALYFSSDAGLNWTPLQFSGDHSLIYSVAVPSSSADPVFVACAQGLFQGSTAGGTWNRIENDLPKSTMSAVRYHPSRTQEVFASSYGQLYRSIDAGRNWKPIPSGDIQVPEIRSLWVPPQQPDRLLAVTADLGVLSLDLAETR